MVYKSFQQIGEAIRQGELSLTDGGKYEEPLSTRDKDVIKIVLTCWLPKRNGIPAKFGNAVTIEHGGNIMLESKKVVQSLINTLTQVATTGKDFDGIACPITQKIKETILCQKETYHQ